MLGLPAEDLALLTSDPAAARIHVSFMGKDLLPEALLEKMATGGWPRIVAFRPTGESSVEGLGPRIVAFRPTVESRV